MTEKFLMKICGWLAIAMVAAVVLGFILNFLEKGHP
jgi:hypothetical protein